MIAARTTVAMLAAVRPRFAEDQTGQRAFDYLCTETGTWFQREIEALRFEKAH